MSGKIIHKVRLRQALADSRRSLATAQDRALAATNRKPPKNEPRIDLGALSGYGGYVDPPPTPLDPISRFFRWVFRL